jgi:2-phospho-L-lactate guanylyltransferase
MNSLSQAKTRLGNILTQEEKGELLMMMLADVLDALDGLEAVVISPDEIDLGCCTHFVHEKKKEGLNAAVAKGTLYSLKKGAGATLFIPVDTPLIKKRHVQEILELGHTHPFIISPSKRGGTGIVYRRPPSIVGENFTATSFNDHLEDARSRRVPVYVYDSFSLSLDIDTPEDVKEFMEHGKGTRTYDYLESRL